MNIQELKSKYRLIKTFIDLAEIPSPSLKEDKVADKIIEILKKLNVVAQKDSYGNVIARLTATKGYENVPSLLLSAHMDVVGDSSPLNISLSANKKYIETDKTRSLGSDDKAGAAAMIDLTADLISNPELNHGPLELLFTRDEETGMTGIRNVNYAEIESKYALIVDGDNLGQHFTEGAGFTNVYVSVVDGIGGHSGINIHDKNRVNAIKVLSEVDCLIPQGVYKQHPTKGVITSINAGVAIGGTANTYISEIINEIYELGENQKGVPDKFKTKNILKTISREAGLNSINPCAYQAYSIRSSDPENEQELIDFILDKVEEVNNKYQNKIKIIAEKKPHLPAFVNKSNNILSQAIIQSSKDHNLPTEPASIHAGTEAHVLANCQNKYGETFNPIIIGVADLENIHSSDEQLDWQSFLVGKKWLNDIIINFAQKHK